jgi:apolipoprotein N-acyltransferase
VLDNHVQQTLRLAAEVRAGTQPQPDLVLWPENSSDVDPILDPSARAEVTRAVQAVRAPILVGAIRLTADGRYRLNEGILWSPSSGPGATYVKRHPVPFGEYIPLRSIARMVSSDVNLVDRDMIGGHGNGLLRGGPVPFGDVICFEVAYDGLVRSSVSAGAQFLVVQTNNATFGRTAETYQQLAMSRLRAVETDRTVLQVATTGKSAVIAPDGTVTAESGALFQPAILTADIAPRHDTTLAVRLGSVPEYALGALAVFAAMGAIVARRRPTASKATPVSRQEEMVQA